MKKSLLIIVLLTILVFGITSQSLAQSTEQLQLGLSRDWGYGGLGNDIQGLFTAHIKDPPANITRVEFYIDDTMIGEDVTPPFSLQFNTDSYPLGLHTIYAIGSTSDGTTINSNKLEMNFVPAKNIGEVLIKFILPLILLIIVIALIAVFLPLVLSKGKLSSTPLGEPRKYGIGGGGICPKCGRPFPLRLWFINLGASKIDRCPYCGKWSMVRPRSTTELRAAEAAELSQAGSGPAIEQETEEAKLKRDLDDSRFQDT
jgi:DNA-directed RNA polymerase subunit RPC12/RpoP